MGANQKLAHLLGHERAELRGLMGGEAFACVHSLLPEGCGKTVHCRECTIRRTVEKVTKTGKPVSKVPAYLQTKNGRVNLRISVRAKDGLVRIVVDEMKPAEPAPARA